MKKIQIMISMIVVSTLFFCTWYFTLYRYAEQRLNDGEKSIASCIKNCHKTKKFEQSCSLEKECLTSLHNQYQQCIEANTCAQNESTMHLLIELLEKNNLTLGQYKTITKEKKEWHTRSTATLSFTGALAQVLSFFEQLSSTMHNCIPLSIDMHTNDKRITSVNTTISWIMYT